MSKDVENQLAKIAQQACMSRKESVVSQLDRLIYLDKQGVIKHHEMAQLDKLRRELAEIEYAEQKRPSSNPPPQI